MILMNDFAAEGIAVRKAMLSAAERVLGSGWYVLGREVETFEQRWSEACGVSFCIGVGNGMDAIELALRAQGIGVGHEVITTSMTAFATVLAILRAGATPVLADIDPTSGQLCLESAERCLTPRTRAVILVHLYGQIRDMGLWGDLCRRTGVLLVEDCAQAHLARWDGKAAGSFGVAGAFSFYPTKNLGCIGDGGALVTSDAELALRVRRMRNYGQSERYVHTELGMNSRLDELQAAILSVRLEWLDAFTLRRQAIARRYQDEMRHSSVTLLQPPDHAESHVYHLFVVRSRERSRLQTHLKELGVQTLSHYPIPVHRQAPCAGLRCDPQGMPHTDLHARECLSLPCHPQMSDADVNKVIDAVNRFPAGA